MDDGTKQALKDYGSLFAYLIPCSIVVAFVNLLLVPRFERISQEFGTVPPGPLELMISSFRFFFDHFWVVVPLLLLPVILAEIFWAFWRSRRGLILSSLKWLMVFSVMVALVALGTSALALIPFATKP